MCWDISGTARGSWIWEFGFQLPREITSGSQDCCGHRPRGSTHNQGETAPLNSLEESRTDSAVVSFPDVAWKPSVLPLNAVTRFPAAPFQQSHDHLNTFLEPFLSYFKQFPAAHDSSPCHFLGFALFSPERGTLNRVTRCMTQKFTPSMEAKALCFLGKPKGIEFQETLTE